MPLFVCATPIGHLDDVSLRLLETLREVVLICAEDTRHTQKLLNRHAIATPLTSCHQHTSPAKIAALAARLESGESLALVTDAGTPGISDPGPSLVRAAIEHEVAVIPIPGPCALTAALSVSGFDAQRFSFLGFLPRKPGRLKKMLLEALAREETIALYESPYRVMKTLQVLSTLAPSRQIALCRELSKKFEETLRGNAEELLQVLSVRKEVLGEFVVIIDGVRGGDETSPDEPDESTCRSQRHEGNNFNAQFNAEA